MGNEQGESLSSFICYNCNQKNFYDKEKYTNKNEGELKSGKPVVKEVSIECNRCREISIVRIEY